MKKPASIENQPLRNLEIQRKEYESEPAFAHNAHQYKRVHRAAYSQVVK